MAVNLNITSTVKMLLEKFPECRDNDNALILKVWAEDNPEIKIDGYIFKDFELAFTIGLFSSTESIRRTRQELQKNFPELRGQKYNARHNHQEVIKEQLKEPEMYAGGIP